MRGRFFKMPRCLYAQEKDRVYCFGQLQWLRDLSNLQQAGSGSQVCMAPYSSALAAPVG